MPRPRVYELDRVLDAVESLAAESGPAAVTMRAVSATVGVSNGALYHSFESRAGLVGRARVRAGRRFMTVQSSLVDQALATGPQHAVLAAADAPVVFAEQHPESSTLLWSMSGAELLDMDPPDDVVAGVGELQKSLIDMMIRLADTTWGRRDGRAVDTITTCIVDLPTAIMLHRNRLSNPTAREHLRAAVRAVLDVGPPPRKGNTP